MSNLTPARPATDLEAAAAFFRSVFGHEALTGLHIGTSQIPPKGGIHVWHPDPEAAAEWAAGHADAGNVYFRTSVVREIPAQGRAPAQAAAAIVGVHADIDIAGPAHTKSNLPPDLEAALRVVGLVGIAPTIIVHSGHGLQAHWLLKEPWVFGEGDLERATALAKVFGLTIRACAESLEYTVDNVADLARLLRVPGTTNHKAEPVPVTVLKADGPRYEIADIEAILIDPGVAAEDQWAPADVAPAEEAASGGESFGFKGTDDELLEAARRARNGALFKALFDRGDITAYGADHSRADWHLADMLAFWCGPDRARIVRLFRRSKLVRPKWDEKHASDGKTYGDMTIEDVLDRRKVFYKPRPDLPVVIVSSRQLREITADALAAIELANNRAPVIFQRGRDLVRVRTDATTGGTTIQVLDADAIVGLMTRTADYVRIDETGGRIGVKPPVAVAKDILSLPSWKFPPLAGIAESPRMRADGSVLSKPGYDAATQLWLAPYPGWREFRVPDHPSNAEVEQALNLIQEMLWDFPFVSDADRANAIAFMLTPILRPAVKGAVPVAAFDALSKQGTGKGLLVRCCMIVANGREPAMTAIPSDEPEWRKSLTAIMAEGKEVVVFDNATGSIIESGCWANTITADVFDDRILGATKRIAAPVRCTWAITGNSMAFGGDMVRRTYQVMQDARVERPEDRTEFKHELPAWAQENRQALLRACLILARRWWSDGCPTPRVAPWGSFEEWTRVVGGVLENAGVRGFLDNRVTFREQADLDRGQWFVFAEALYREFGDRPFKSSDVVESVDASAGLKEALPEQLRDALDQKKSFSTRVGKALRKHSGAVFGSYRIATAGKDTHAKRSHYRVEVVGHSETAARAALCGTSPVAVNCADEIPV